MSAVTAYRSQVERLHKLTKKLMSLAPDQPDWKPGENFMSLGDLLNHLSGINRAIIRSVKGPDAVPPVGPDKAVTAQAAISRMEEGFAAAIKVLDELPESDYLNKEVETQIYKGPLYGMLSRIVEHQTNHKMQLFFYLKLLGKPVNTQTLYTVE
ncbi:MAG: DinB family protein [Candidatus Tectomicrobia bacterium]|nr:DinB family protein [Candidatus Tectomicrobia bacterium]